MKPSGSAFMALLWGPAISASSTNPPAPMDGPAAVVQARHESQIAGKVDAAAALFADDAVTVCSPNSFSRGARFMGRSEIRADMQREPDSGAKVDTCGLQVSGDAVTCRVSAHVDGTMVSNTPLKAVAGDGRLVSQAPG